MIDALKILGSLLGNGDLSSGSGSNILKSVLDAVNQGSGQSSSGQSGSQYSNQPRTQPSSQRGGLGDLLGGLLNQGGSSFAGAGGLQDILKGVLGGSQSQAGSGGGGLGDLLGSALSQFGQSKKTSSGSAAVRNFEPQSHNLQPEQANEKATVLIRAMIAAAKSDGRIDNKEQAHILNHVGDITAAEQNFLREELAQSLDVNKLIRSIPADMAVEAYTMSLMAIDLDSNAEAQYLNKLAQGLQLQPKMVNQIHGQLGAPTLYS